MASGQIIAQALQPVQSVLSDLAGKKPFLLDFSDTTMQLFGHTIMHKPQPLHRSILILILPAIWIIMRKFVCCLFDPWILTGISSLVKPKPINSCHLNNLSYWIMCIQYTKFHRIFFIYELAYSLPFKENTPKHKKCKSPTEVSCASSRVSTS